MNIYFKKKIALQYILIFTLNAITDMIKFCTRLVFEIIVATFSNILRLIEFSCNWNIFVTADEFFSI